MGFQVVGEDRRRLIGRGAVGEIRREGRRASTKRRRNYTDLGLDLGERDEHVACRVSALAIRDKTCWEAEM